MDRAVAAALHERDCDTEAFLARQLTQGDVDEADLIITAAREQRAEVVRMSPRALARCFALLDLADLAAAVDPNSYGPAPLEASWVQHVTARLAAHRGLVPPRAAETADVADPTGQGSRAYGRMVRDIEGALPALLGCLVPATSVTSRRR
jgi:protein-tyrosine phosphatase